MTLLSEIYALLAPHAGKSFVCTLTKNKGVAGFLVESLAGIPQSSSCLDCEDGEVKCFPLKRLKNGKLVPKETIAVTMIQQERLTSTAWADSNAYKKLQNCLYIPYLRVDPDNITLYTPYVFNIAPSMPIYAALNADYDAIVTHARTTGSLSDSSRIGIYLQNRTKGAGHGSTSRAFYLRPSFIIEHILTHCGI
jgi:DNA mismatch repair protein MutH